MLIVWLVCEFHCVSLGGSCAHLVCIARPHSRTAWVWSLSSVFAWHVLRCTSQAPGSLNGLACKRGVLHLLGAAAAQRSMNTCTSSPPT